MKGRPSPLVAVLAILALAVSFRSVARPAPVRRLAVSASRAPSSAAGLGHDARAPSDIPPAGWWDVLKRTGAKFSENELMSEAAGVTFYALLSLFPAIAALISLYGLVADPRTISEHLEMVSGFIPGGGMDIIKEQVTRLTQNPSGSLGFGVVIGIATALWSANQGSKAVFSALNTVYDEREKRGFLTLTAVTLAFTGGALVFLLLMLGAVVIVPIVLNFVGLKESTDLLVRVGRWPAMLVLITGFLAILYRVAPSREPARWRWLTWGGAFSATAWIALSIGFSWYVTHFGNYNKTYGSLGAVVGFMTWIWLSTTVILLGAQLNAELELQTACDTTTGAALPMGARGARRANRVAA